MSDVSGKFGSVAMASMPKLMAGIFISGTPGGG